MNCLNMSFLYVLTRQVFLVLVVLLLFTSTGTGAKEPKRGSETKLTVYKITKRGGYLSKTFESNGNECSQIPRGWNEVYQRWAVAVVGGCISLYESPNCDGRQTDISNQKTSFKEKIKRIGLVNSFRSCSHIEEIDATTPAAIFYPPKQSTYALGLRRQVEPSSNSVKPPAVERNRLTFYTGSRFRGQKLVTELKPTCENIPEDFRNEVSSIQTPDKCVRIFAELNCQGRSIQIQTFDRYKDDLSMLDFNNRVQSYSSCEAFQQYGLDLHNYFRELHNTPPLEMDESVRPYEEMPPMGSLAMTMKLCPFLNQAAQLMAEYLAMQPALPKPIGFISSELLYANSNATRDRNALVEEAITSWYKEAEQYDPKNPVNSRFTQLIWRNTRKFGMGTARNGNRAVVVANYFPRGNFAGQFQQNVLPLKVQ